MTGLAKIAVPVLGLLLVAAGIAGAVLWGGRLFANSAMHEEPVTPSNSASIPRAAVPPMDAAAPAEIETATFALG